MTTDVLREFLVSLGFKTDEPTLKKFERGISQATKAVVTLAAAVETTALAVSVGVARFASNLEQLYFASQRTGASATNLKAFDRAARDLGASAGEAQASIEGLARFMRNSPAGEGVLASWFGINTRGANGKPLDPVDMALAISKAMQSMPQWQALMLGRDAGLSENTVLAMLNPAFAKNFDTIADRLKRAGFKQASEDAHRFMMDLRTLGDVLVILGTRIEDALQQKLGISLKSITNWIDQNSGWIIAEVIKIGTAFIGTFNDLVTWLEQNGPLIQHFIHEAFAELMDVQKLLGPAIKWLLEEFKNLDAATDGWSTKLVALGVLLKATGTASIVGGVLGLAAAFVRLGASLGSMAAGSAMAGITALGGILGPLALIAAAGGIGYVIGSAVNNAFPGLSNWLGGKMEQFHDWFSKQNTGYVFGSGGNQNARKDWIMQKFQDLGWSKDQAAGWAANAFAESSFDPNAENQGHRGLFQWDQNRWAAFERFAKIAGVETSDPDAQVRFANYEARYGTEQRAGGLLAAARNSDEAGQIVSHYYERPGLPVQDSLRGARAAQFANETTINVHGVQSPIETAKIVAGEQERIARLNAAAVREFAVGAQ